jgi:hypothetical protein
LKKKCAGDADVLSPEIVKDAAKKLSIIEASKRLAAWTAVDRHILPEHKVRLPRCFRRQFWSEHQLFPASRIQ